MWLQIARGRANVAEIKSLPSSLYQAAEDTNHITLLGLTIIFFCNAKIRLFSLFCKRNHIVLGIVKQSYNNYKPIIDFPYYCEFVFVLLKHNGDNW